MAAVKAKVMFAYDAEQDDEISLSVDDVVINIDMQDGGWWEGELKGKRGLFPENFVEVIKEEAPNVSKSASLPKATVTFDYVAVEQDELDLKVGDIIEVVKQDEVGWWEGKFNGKIGMFPSNFVELIIDDKASMHSNIPAKQPLIGTGKKEPASEHLIDFKEQNEKNPPNLPPGRGDADDENIDGNKPKQPMGFGFALSNADLLKARLRPVSGIEDQKTTASKEDAASKPMQRVPPLGKGEDGVQNLKKAEPFGDGSNIKRNAPAPPKVPVVAESIPASSEGERFIVKFAYKPENEDELALKIGQMVIVTDKDVCEGWWEGKTDGKTGVFPNNFVEPAPEPAEESVKEKVAAKKVPLLPFKKAQPSSAKDVKEGITGTSHSESRSTPLEAKKPLIPENRKPSVPETSKTPLAEPNKPMNKKTEIKKPPPPMFKNKPVPPKPNVVDKQSNDDNETISLKDDSNPPRIERPRMTSLSRKPPVNPSSEAEDNQTGSSKIESNPPRIERPRMTSLSRKPPVNPSSEAEDNQTGSSNIESNPPRIERLRMTSLSRKPPVNPSSEAVPPVVKESIPARPDKPKTDTVKNIPKEDTEEVSRIDLDSVSSGEVLSNVNKTRIKGPPGKTLPTKYNQKKDEETEKQDEVEENNQPPWKKEIAHKLPGKRAVKTSQEEKTAEKEQPRAVPSSAPGRPSITKDMSDDVKQELSSMREKFTEMEKKFMMHIKVLTDDLDSERKQRATLQIELDRLKKKVTILEGL